VSRGQVEAMVDQLGGGWDEGLSALLDQAIEREARSSVNVQIHMERERRCLGHEPLTVPLGVFLDERLPGEARGERAI